MIARSVGRGENVLYSAEAVCIHAKWSYILRAADICLVTRTVLIGGSKLMEGFTKKKGFVGLPLHDNDE